jgi:hypothetical protein
MARDGTRRPMHRFLVACLALWLAFTAAQATVHNHPLPGSGTGNPAFDLPEASSAQAVCFACLASHVPAPAAVQPVLISAPIVRADLVLPEDIRAPRSGDVPSGPSRAPPSFASAAA